MTSFALLFTLSAIGIAETVYLVKKRIADEKPHCVIGGGCQLVLRSKFNKIFFIHNDIAGLLFYIVMAFVTAFMVLEIRLDLAALSSKILVGAGSLMSLFLVFLQWKVIKAWCFWCLMSALTIFLMQLIILLT